MLKANEKDVIRIIAEIVSARKNYFLIHNSNNLQETDDYIKLFTINIAKDKILDHSNIIEYFEKNIHDSSYLNITKDTRLELLKNLIEKNLIFKKMFPNQWYEILFCFKYSIQQKEKNKANLKFILSEYKKPVSIYVFKELIELLLKEKDYVTLLSFLKNHPNKITQAIINKIRVNTSNNELNEFLSLYNKNEELFKVKEVKMSKISISLESLSVFYYFDISLAISHYVKPINFFLKQFLKLNKNIIHSSNTITKLNEIIILNEFIDYSQSDKLVEQLKEFLTFYFLKQHEMLSNEVDKSSPLNIYYKNHQKIIKELDNHKFFSYLKLKDSLLTNKITKNINKI